MRLLLSAVVLVLLGSLMFTFLEMFMTADAYKELQKIISGKILSRFK